MMKNILVYMRDVIGFVVFVIPAYCIMLILVTLIGAVCEN